MGPGPGGRVWEGPRQVWSGTRVWSLKSVTCVAKVTFQALFVTLDLSLGPTGHMGPGPGERVWEGRSPQVPGPLGTQVLP